MPPITVDPETLSGAGESIDAVGDEIAAAVNTLASSLSGGARSGTDPAGLVFGHSYQQLAQGLLDAGAAGVNAGRNVGFGVQMSATNYSRADAASTIGGGAPALSPPDTPGEFSGPAAPSAQGGGVPPPLLWSVIQSFIPDVWPDGDPASLRATGNAWQSFATTISGIAGHLAAPSGVVAGQQIPEGAAMTSAISKLTQSLTDIASEAGKLATQTQEFADDVENTQNAIRDLLDRGSPSGLLDGFMSVINGDALEELKEIAEDVKTVLGDYGRQAEARRDMLQIAMGAVDDAIVSVEQWARREFPKYLGDDVGNALATALDFELTLGQGLLAGGVDLVDGIGQFDPLRFAYDPEGAEAAWAGMAESLGEGLLYATPTGVLSNPTGAFNHYKDQVADAVHAEDWSSERPGYPIGKILFDVGASAIPGGAATRGTTAAADAAADAVPSPGRMPDTPGGLGSFTSASQRLDDIEANLGEVGDNIPTTPMAAGPNGPAVPEALVDPPSTPRAPETAGTPRLPDSPTPHAPDSTPRAPDSTPVDRSPTSQSSTPAGTPAQMAPDAGGTSPQTGTSSTGAASEARVPSSVDTPLAPQQPPLASSSSSAPPNSPAPPPVASHATDAHTAATHTPASTTPDPSPPARSDAAGTGPTDGDLHVAERADRSPGQAAGIGDSHSSPAEEGRVTNPVESPDGTHNLTESEGKPRIYSLMDEGPHRTAFAPEQLPDSRRISDALDKHDVTKSDFVDLINKPTDSLSQEQRGLINAVRDELPAPTRDTVMQKVIPPGYFDDSGNFVQSRADDYIMGNNDRVTPARVGGAVTFADDTANLATPAQIYDGLRLDYSNSPFAPHDQGTHLIRFQEDPGSSGSYEVPRNSDMGGDGTYDTWDDPFTGSGFTKSVDEVVPEYIAKNITMRHGAEMWEVLDDGTQRLVAVLKDKVWIPQGN